MKVRWTQFDGLGIVTINKGVAGIKLKFGSDNIYLQEMTFIWLKVRLSSFPWQHDLIESKPKFWMY